MPIKNIPCELVMGVYAITDQHGKSHIGSSNDIARRARQHCRDLRNGAEGKKLQQAYNAGEEFSLHILRRGYEGMLNTELLEAEREEIINRGGIENTYNCVYNQHRYKSNPVYFPAVPRHDTANNERISITVPKGQKAVIEAAANAAGESVNQYTQRALLARMGLETWPVIDENKQ